MKPSLISEQCRKADIRVPAWLLLEWLQDPERGPANTSFTDGPLRVIAVAIEQLLKAGVDTDAARYRALRGSLTGKPGCSVTFMPRLLDPFDAMITYTPDGLDKALDDAIRSMKRDKK